jgi:flagellin-like hook-associated protein FlgL
MRAKSRAVLQLSSGVTAPEQTGGQAAYVYKLRNGVTRQRAVEQGMVNAISFLDAQAGALQSIYKGVVRMDELASRLQDITQNRIDPETGEQPDLENYMKEFSSVADEIWKTRSASFNGRDLLYVTGARPALQVSLSMDGNRNLALTPSDFSVEPTWRYLLGTTSPATAPGRDPATVYVSTAADVADPTVMGAVGFERLLQDLSEKIATNGAQRRQLEAALAHSRGKSNQTDLAAGVAGDTDVARVLTAMARTDVLTQGSLAVRTQANVLADAALQVLSRPLPTASRGAPFLS